MLHIFIVFIAGLNLDSDDEHAYLCGGGPCGGRGDLGHGNCDFVEGGGREGEEEGRGENR